MASPTSYTEIDLAVYMASIAGEIMTYLGWTAEENQVAEAVNETLLAYGTDDISTITESTNIRKLRAVARREIWRAIVNALASFIDYSAPDGQALKESQLQTQAAAALALAESDCDALGIDAGGYTVETSTVCYPHHHHWQGEFGSWWR
jgi:hypothetical protein